MGVSMAKSKARRIAAEAGVLSFGRTRAHSSNPLDHVSAGGVGGDSRTQVEYAQDNW